MSDVVKANRQENLRRFARVICFTAAVGLARGTSHSFTFVEVAMSMALVWGATFGWSASTIAE
jgi:hypothetical protein